MREQKKTMLAACRRNVQHQFRHFPLAWSIWEGNAANYPGRPRIEILTWQKAGRDALSVLFLYSDSKRKNKRESFRRLDSSPAEREKRKRKKVWESRSCRPSRVRYCPNLDTVADLHSTWLARGRAWQDPKQREMDRLHEWSSFLFILVMKVGGESTNLQLKQYKL